MELFKYIVKFIYRIRWWATNQFYILIISLSIVYI